MTLSHIFTEEIDNLSFERVVNDSSKIDLDIYSTTTFDNQVYIFFKGDSNLPEICLARMAFDQIEDRSVPFQFFKEISNKNPIFVNNKTASGELKMDQSPSNPFSIVFSPILSHFVVVFDEFLSQKIDLNYARTPWGPFSSSSTIFQYNSTVKEFNGLISSTSVNFVSNCGTYMNLSFSVNAIAYPLQTSIYLKIKQI